MEIAPLGGRKWTTSVFINIYSLVSVQFLANLAMITALKFLGLLHAFRCVLEKNKNVVHQPRSVRIGKKLYPLS